MIPPLITDANAEDAVVLTALVRTSGAYAGEYRVMVANQTIDAAYIGANPVRVARGPDGTPHGFYSLQIPGMGNEGEGELDFMFVADDLQRRGIGRALFDDMIELARRLQRRRVHIVSHPSAEAFYLGRGARAVGQLAPRGTVTWSRPHLVLDLA